MTSTIGLYRRYLKAPDLPENGANLKIQKATVEKTRPRPSEERTRAILWFKAGNGSDVAFVLNQGNYNHLVRLANGEEDTDKWAGLTIRLTPSKYGQKDTVILGPPKMTNGNGAKK